jgi:spore coat protein U-like protein
MKRSLSYLVPACLILLITGVAYAASSTASLRVTATVAAYCTVSTNPVDFGAVSGVGETSAGAVGNVSVNCPASQTYHVTMDAGQHVSGASRQISSGVYAASYQLHKDSVVGPLWGDSDFSGVFPGGSSLVGTGSGSAQDHDVYGSLRGFSGIPPGTVLSDTVTVTVYY